MGGTCVIVCSKNRAVSRLLRIDKLLFVTSAHRGDACNYRPPPLGPRLSAEEVHEQPRTTDYSHVHAADFRLHVCFVNPQLHK